MYETVNNDAEPDLKLGGLSLWVLSRQFPDSNDFWDGNWLHVQVRAEDVGAVVEVSGPILRIDEIIAFSKQLEELDLRLQGSARLKCLEPNLELSVDCGPRGQIGLRVNITPNHLTQSHAFQFEIDQSYLKPVIRSCHRLVDQFSPKGSKATR